MTRLAFAIALLLTALGINYLVTPQTRLNASPGLAFAQDVLTLRAWGVLYLLAAACLGYTLHQHRPQVIRYGLLLGGVCMAIWAAVLALAALLAVASPTAWCWPAFVAYVARYAYLSQPREA